ncbi:hypothetical protein ACEPAH_8025 [Sanghuangporus vaninii]
MAPIQVVRWIKQAYPKPAVNSEWLDACCTWIADEMHLNPATQTEAFIAEVENQLLESDLRDSMEPGTGLPRNARAMNNQRIRGLPHILVEVTAIMEVGHSAFNLHNVRQARIERADLAGLAQEEGAENDEGSIPNYPRTMLRLEISDGTVTMPAIEYRSLPSLKLEETPLGFKLLLKDVLVRRGIIFLEPKGIVLKGHRNGDRDEFRERDFVHGLLRRMMKPIPQAQDQGEDRPDENQPPPQDPSARAQTPAAQARVPLREISEPPEFREDAMDMDDEADLPRKRRIPNPNTNNLPSSSTTRVSSSASSTNTLVASHFFGTSSSAANDATATAIEATTQRLARVLSPVRGDPIDITDSSMEDPVSFATRPSSTAAAGSSRPAQNIGLGNEIACTRISYEEFEFDDDDEELDAAFLDEIAKVEKEALAKEARQTVSQAVSYSRDSSTVPSGSVGRTKREAERRSNTPIAAAAVSSSSTATPASGVQRPARPTATNQATRSRARVQPHLSTTMTSAATIITQSKASSFNAHDDVITIDDEDDDDKENVPIPKRRVRRRLSAFPPPPMPDDVIDISD